MGKKPKDIGAGLWTKYELNGGFVVTVLYGNKGDGLTGQQVIFEKEGKAPWVGTREEAEKLLTPSRK